MNKRKMKFTIEVNIDGALINKNYDALYQRLMSQETPLTFHQLVMLIPAFRLHKFSIRSAEVEGVNGTSLINIKNVNWDLASS